MDNAIQNDATPTNHAAQPSQAPSTATLVHASSVTNLPTASFESEIESKIDSDIDSEIDSKKKLEYQKSRLKEEIQFVQKIWFGSKNDQIEVVMMITLITEIEVVGPKFLNAL